MIKRVLIIAFVAVLACTAIAEANFTAYNDCAMASTGNVTNYQPQTNTWNPGASGLLIDYATGNPTGVTCTGSASATDLILWEDPVVNVPYAAGTDAANLFNGKIDFTGSPELRAATEWYQYDFTGLDTSKTYVFASAMNRNNSGYTTRLTTYTLSGATSWVNESSTGTDISVDGLSTTYCPGWNTENGYVASWTITDSSEFSVRAQFAPGVSKTYGFGEIMLQEVPEPSSIVMLVMGIFGLLGYSRRRRS